MLYIIVPIVIIILVLTCRIVYLLRVTERRRVYRRALFAFQNKLENTDYGFCHYFQMNGIKLKRLPELIKQKPKPNKYSVHIYGSYWYPSGNRTPRIEALNAAIELCNKKLL